MDAQVHKKIGVEALSRRVKGNYLNNPRVMMTKIFTNYFNVKILANKFQKIFIFKIVINPQIPSDNRIFREQLLKKALPSIQNQIKNPVFGGMNIYSTTEPVKEEETHTVDQYAITIKKVRSFSPKENPKVFLHFLNNAVRNTMNILGYMEIGQTGKYFNKKQSKQIVHDLSLYPGFRVNFLFGEMGLFLRIDPTCKIVQTVTVLEFINSIYKKNEHKPKEERRQLVIQALIGKIVMTNYGKTKYVRIENIEFKNLTEVFLPNAENQNIIDYYFQKYNVTVRANQPLLKVQNKNKKDANIIYMLPQLCLMTGMPEDIDQNKRRSISDMTITPPQTKFNCMKKLIGQLKETTQMHSLRQLGIQIQSQPQQVMAKTLPCPEIYIGKQNKIDKGRQSSFNLFNQEIFDSAHKLKVGLIHFERQSVSQIYDQFIETGKNLGLKIKIQCFKVSSSSSTSSLQDLTHKIERAAKQATEKQECNCCLIVLRSDMKKNYPRIKNYCLDELKVVSQVVVENTLRKKNVKSIHTKILLQAAVKIGNTLWAPQIPKQLVDKAMLVSYDLSSAGSQRKLIGVGTINKNMTKFTSQSVNLDNSNDKHVQMAKILISLVTRFVQRNEYVPTQIIILTNSCPKNQVKLIYDYYIPLVQKQLKQIPKLKQPIKISIVQLKDLSNERFFVESSDRKEMMNPGAGLLVNDTIVSEGYDFYLLSQKARTGCTVPSHYEVIYSNSSMQEGILQTLMYNQCFNYANWSGSIKIPAIMQYAKKFARFSSEVMDKKNVQDKNLYNKLYFI